MVIVDNTEILTEEEKRLKQDRLREKYWKKWGPYVAERQWATGSSDLPCSCGSVLIRWNSERRLLVSKLIHT